MDKQTLRKKYQTLRNNILDKEIKSKIITEKIINTDEYKQAKIIALYKSLKSEVNTDELIEHSLSIGKVVALPKVTDDNLAFYRLNSLTDELIKSSFGVLEPKSDPNNYIDKSAIDLIIVPGVCFDKEKNRLGFGKGYYDYFLKDSIAHIFGICFNEQLLTKELIPKTANDIKMHLIITDKEIY